jgi:hypothetical protein
VRSPAELFAGARYTNLRRPRPASRISAENRYPALGQRGSSRGAFSLRTILLYWRWHLCGSRRRPGMAMTNNLKLLLSLLAFQAGMVLPASSQQNQPIGTANAIGSVSNTNAAVTPSSSTAQSASPGSRSSPGILLPNGGRATTSNSTIVVCDDPGAPFPDQVDVCSLR